MMAFKYKDAINDCLIAIGSDKKYILAYKRISTCYFQLNDPDSAEEILEKGLKSCPGNCELQEKVNIRFNQINNFFFLILIIYFLILMININIF